MSISAAHALLGATLPVYVVSDSPAEAQHVKSLLDGDFQRVLVCLAADFATLEPAQAENATFVLVFKDFRNTEPFCRQLRQRRNDPLATLRVIALCGKESVSSAFVLCRQRVIDDYVLFWPLTYDTTRLRQVVHRTLGELAASLDDPLAATITAQALRIEALEAALDEREKLQREVGTAERAEPDPSPPTAAVILIVDDDPFQRKLTGRVLESAGYRVHYADTGAAALDVLGGTRIDLILMDYRMPHMSGLDVTHRLRSEPRFAAIPIVMLTGCRERDVVLESSRLGVAGFVVKPFERELLIGKIDRILAQDRVRHAVS